MQPGSPAESSGSLGTSLFPSLQLGLKRTLRCGGTSVLIVDPVPFRAMPTAPQHGNEVKSTSFVLCSEAAMMERAPMASIIGAGTNLKTALAMQMFWQLVQFAYDSSE